MLVFRFIGALFLLLAVIALTADLSGPIPGPNGSVGTERSARVKNVVIYQDGKAKRSFASLYQHWQNLAPVSLRAARRTVETKVHPLLWNPVIRTVLEIPAFITLGVLALLFLHLGRRRRRVEIFEN